MYNHTVRVHKSVYVIRFIVSHAFAWKVHLEPSSVLKPFRLRWVFPFSTNIGGMDFPTALAHTIMVFFSRLACSTWNISSPLASHHSLRSMYQGYSSFITIPYEMRLLDESTCTENIVQIKKRLPQLQN